MQSFTVDAKKQKQIPTMNRGCRVSVYAQASTAKKIESCSAPEQQNRKLQNDDNT